MTTNETREKLIKGLECCIKRAADDMPRCDECPYGGACANELKKDALELLQNEKNHENHIEQQKSGEARLLTQAEAESILEGVTVWVEQWTPAQVFLMPMVATGDGIFGNFYLGIIAKDLNKGSFRMWLGKPTQEQMDREPWHAIDKDDWDQKKLSGLMEE